jgi:hypothetical protein
MPSTARLLVCMRGYTCILSKERATELEWGIHQVFHVCASEVICVCGTVRHSVQIALQQIALQQIALQQITLRRGYIGTIEACTHV